jgi:RNA ligase (TIGR02306 family)
MPSDLIVEVVKILSIDEHPNADRLELATVKGWQCVVQKGVFKTGDKVLYIPIDSMLPHDLEASLFPPESKIKLRNHRVKTERIRQAISQGLVITLDEAGLESDIKVGTDVKERLNITKYVPPIKHHPMFHGRKASKKETNPEFHKYTSINNIRNFNKVLADYNMVVGTEKIHGTNFRAGWVKRNLDTWWKRLWLRWKKLWFRALSIIQSPTTHKSPEYEFLYGSHNVQYKKLGGGAPKGSFYKTNVYQETVETYSIKEKLSYGEVVYGEIYGDGIQKGYVYGCGPNIRKLVVFDVMIDGKYLDYSEAIKFCRERDLPFVPLLYIGPPDKDQIDNITRGPSTLSADQPVREGAVFKPVHESWFYGGRTVFKSINQEYLLGKYAD